MSDPSDQAEPAEVTNLFLVSQSGNVTSGPFRLRLGESTVGRDSKSDVYLNHRAVSRRHAQLVVTHDRVEVTDLESHNGTFINEKRVKSSELQLGENVRFGAIKLVLIRKDPHDSSDDSTHTIRQYNFTAAHLRVLELLKKGLSEKKIAAALDLSPHTVHNHVREIYRICDVHSRAELFRKLFPQDTEEI